MDTLVFSTGTAKLHAPLVQRAAAVVTALVERDRLMLRDAAELTAPTGAAITLMRGAVPSLSREGNSRRFTLTYADAASHGVLAALLACTARAGAPIAADPESLSVLALAERLAASDIPVLIGGPTGTGKEVLSRFIHNRSPRAQAPFVAVNCAAMPETMLEALLFGHTKGAFTGATQAHEGFFRAADGGTLLLDEIAEMPLALQAKLLRALQEGEVVPIGSTKPIPIDVRIIASANRDLPTEVAEGRFRADLYYRLNVFPLSLKPLRERPADIAPLAFAMLLRHTNAGQKLAWIGDEALAMLEAHGWPGNVRELENVIRRAMLLAGSADVITPEHISFDRPARLVAPEEAAEAPVATGPITGPITGLRRLANIVQRSEAGAILETLDACGGNRIAAARALGISERTLRYRLAAFREAGLNAAPVAAGAGR